MWSVLGIPMCVNEHDMCFYLTQGWKVPGPFLVLPPQTLTEGPALNLVSTKVVSATILTEI